MAELLPGTNSAHPIVRAAAGRLLVAAKAEDESCADDCERAEHKLGSGGASMVWGTPLQLATVVVPAVLRAAAARIDPTGALTGKSRASAAWFEASRENARTLRTLADEIEQGTGGGG